MATYKTCSMGGVVYTMLCTGLCADRLMQENRSMTANITIGSIVSLVGWGENQRIAMEQGLEVTMNR
jgi:hypothetical protein